MPDEDSVSAAASSKARWALAAQGFTIHTAYLLSVGSSRFASN